MPQIVLNVLLCFPCRIFSLPPKVAAFNPASFLSSLGYTQLDHAAAYSSPVVLCCKHVFQNCPKCLKSILMINVFLVLFLQNVCLTARGRCFWPGLLPVPTNLAPHHCMCCFNISSMVSMCFCSSPAGCLPYRWRSLLSAPPPSCPLWDTHSCITLTISSCRCGCHQDIKQCQ